MNEKIYMPVEETDRMYEEEKGLSLYNKTLLLDTKTIKSKYKGKKLIPTTEINSVGIMSAPIHFLKDKLSVPGYLVYTIDEDGEIQKFGVTHLKFNVALCVARQVYISLRATNNIINSKEEISRESEDKGYYLYNEMLYEDTDILSKKYNDKKLIPKSDVKCIGVMSVSNDRKNSTTRKFDYVVYYVNDNKEFLTNSTHFSKFRDALLFAKLVCKQFVCECVIINGEKRIIPVDASENERLRGDYLEASYDVIADKVEPKKKISHSTYVKAYSKMSKKYNDVEPEKTTVIRRRHR